ncbi:MAG: diguanylate cyclase [Candidatus Sumerlaeaceae bacterium]|nr:diguanylate cyclase [Candidatus Sumerlaeaceae bacterium]
MKWLELVEKLGHLHSWGLGVALVALIGLCDLLTGYELAFSLFYVVPVALLAWRFGRLQGMLAAALCAAVWLWADLAAGHVYSHAFYPVWNALIRFSYYALITLLLTALHSALLREKMLARVDSLTGAVNAYSFEERLREELERLSRYQSVFTVAFLDLDNFKSVNDSLGHATGDQVLRDVTESIRRHLRRTDVVARLGGDEFAVLLPQTDAELARTVLEKLRRATRAAMQKHNLPVTCSIGAITCEESPPSPTVLINLADNLMYTVKRSGKDGLRMASFPG